MFILGVHGGIGGGGSTHLLFSLYNFPKSKNGLVCLCFFFIIIIIPDSGILHVDDDDGNLGENEIVSVNYYQYCCIVLYIHTYIHTQT